jgi:cell division protein FtsW (lipid II flippase)
LKKFASFFSSLYSSTYLVFIPGLRAEYGTARSWINIFGYSFSTIRACKLSFLIYLATWLEAKGGHLIALLPGLFLS